MSRLLKIFLVVMHAVIASAMLQVVMNDSGLSVYVGLVMMALNMLMATLWADRILEEVRNERRR